METIGYVRIDGWAGRVAYQVEVIGQTRCKWRIRELGETRLGGRRRWIRRGQVALVPRAAVVFGPAPADAVVFRR